MASDHRRPTGPLRRRVPRRVVGALSLIEGSFLVGIVGTVLAVFLPTFFREMNTSKVAETAEMMSLIADRAAAYYSTGHDTSRGRRRRCLPPSAGPTPPLPSGEPVEVDFSVPPAVNAIEVDEVAEEEGETSLEEHSDTETWIALEVQPPIIRYSHTYEAPRPIRYSYTFEAPVSGCSVSAPEGGPLFIVRAQGDLDEDGELSTFEQAYTVEGGRARPFGILNVDARVE